MPKPKLHDHGGRDKDYNPRSIATKNEHPAAGAFPAHGGPKPMLDCDDKMTHLVKGKK